MIQFSNRKVALSLLPALAVLAVLAGAAFASAQMPQANNTGLSAQSKNNTGGNATTTSSLQLSCDPNSNNTAVSANNSASNTTSAGNNSSASSSSTMAGRPNSANDTATAGSNGANITAIGEAVGVARIHLIEGCNAVNSGDSQGALMHLNLVSRALDSITGNLTGTAGQNTTSGTSTSSVQGAGGQSESAEGSAGS